MHTSSSYRITLFIALSFAFLSMMAQGPSPVAYYPISGNAQDVSGNGNHGFPMGGAILTADKNGVPAEAYYFNGKNAYLEFQNNSQFLPDLPVTITAWVRKDNVGQNEKFMVFYQSFQSQYL